MTKARDIADLGAVTSRLDTVGASDGALSNRNLIINGAMQVAQRGTSTTGITATGYYTSDRWRLEGNTDATFTMENVSDSPDGFSNSTKVTVTTADTSVGSTQYHVVAQRIEAQNLQQLKYGTSSAENLTVSFWVKSSTTDTFVITLEHGETNLYISKQFTIGSANTWEYKTLTFVGDTSLAINNDNGIGLHFYLMLAAGSSYNTGPSSTWTTVSALGGGIDNTWIGTTNATVQITGVQLEVGDTATPFEHRSYGDELARCQRYFAKSYRYDKYAGDTSSLGWVQTEFHENNQGSGYRENYSFPFPVRMRATPTITIYDTAGNAGKCNYYIGVGASNTNRVLNVSSANERTFGGYSDRATTIGGWACHYYADAEL